MRGWMNEGKSYIAPVAIDEVMRAGGIGVVVASESASSRSATTSAARSASRSTRRFDERQIGRGELVKIDLRVGRADAVAQRARHARHDRLLRPDGRRPAEAGRDRRRLGRGRRGRPDGRPARQDQGLPRRRHRRRPGEVRVGRQGARLRRLHRLQGRPGQGGPEGALPERRRRLLRQRRRRDPRRRADADQPQGAHHHLRRDQPVQQHRAGQGPGQLPVAARQPRAHGRHGRVRLRRALPAGDRRDGRLPEGRPHEEPRRRRRRHRHLPRDAAQALPRRELRQARAPGRRRPRPDAKRCGPAPA